ncbi:DsbA family oxidoreductase [Oceanobacillus iheyensis]|uniref:Peptidoglycan hydrolase (DL-endopeptidase II family) (Cell wall-binding protein) n=1 Tax=Oceanobacillus iheyensis (strain DSM 14371 / CIP 107618 / JCM 11309 / KCTC 3954 / HTE831) TaxID=221109 RepID=Q8CXM9_OCEIH|nr:DsbA family oxidoreductase [Oceanobacillus iheyensis]BAC12499.1 peptidoglycan hydrolase (DL-endopeptidase II family) (cell wall-binding protein) [Oceanobacillus iheyensis HTE831]
MKIEVWSDFVCPFCYIGKRRLEKALDHFEQSNEVTIEYKSYQLDPNAKHIPGKNFYDTFSELKGMPLDQVKNMNQQVKEQASEIGLDYNFDDMKYSNTFDAHRVAKLATKQNKGKEITERFLHAYFTESELLSDHQTLIRLAEEVGLTPSEVEEVLNTEKFTNRVNEDIDIARQIGVQGVPFFVFNEKYAVSGAQPEEVFHEVLTKVWEEEKQNPVLKTIHTGNSKTSFCTDEDCGGE